MFILGVVQFNLFYFFSNVFIRFRALFFFKFFFPFFFSIFFWFWLLVGFFLSPPYDSSNASTLRIILSSIYQSRRFVASRLRSWISFASMKSGMLFVWNVHNSCSKFILADDFIIILSYVYLHTRDAYVISMNSLLSRLRASLSLWIHNFSFVISTFFKSIQFPFEIRRIVIMCCSYLNFLVHILERASCFVAAYPNCLYPHNLWYH